MFKDMRQGLRALNRNRDMEPGVPPPWSKNVTATAHRRSGKVDASGEIC
jgi:hypothetical protein